MIGELIGGFLPYIFIAFGFMGCMYPAIDLFTGEKERGTIETMLVVPVARPLGLGVRAQVTRPKARRPQVGLPLQAESADFV